MEKFKITNSIKREIAKSVKNFIEEGKEYTECAVIYNNSEAFFVTETGKIDSLENKGYIVYKIFTHYKADGNITLSEIENKIFR